MAVETSAPTIPSPPATWLAVQLSTMLPLAVSASALMDFAVNGLLVGLPVMNGSARHRAQDGPRRPPRTPGDEQADNPRFRQSTVRVDRDVHAPHLQLLHAARRNPDQPGLPAVRRAPRPGPGDDECHSPARPTSWPPPPTTTRCCRTGRAAPAHFGLLHCRSGAGVWGPRDGHGGVRSMVRASGRPNVHAQIRHGGHFLHAWPSLGRGCCGPRCAMSTSTWPGRTVTLDGPGRRQDRHRVAHKRGGVHHRHRTDAPRHRGVIYRTWRREQ